MSNDSVKYTFDLNAKSTQSFKDVSHKLNEVKSNIKLIGPASKKSFDSVSSEARKVATNITAIKSTSIDNLNSKLDKTKSKLKDISSESKSINVGGSKLKEGISSGVESKLGELTGGIPGGSMLASLGPIGIGVGAI